MRSPGKEEKPGPEDLPGQHGGCRAAVPIWAWSWGCSEHRGIRGRAEAVIRFS